MIRPAVIDDLDALVAVHLAGFRAGNVPHLTDEAADRVTRERSGTAWRQLIESPPAGTVVLAALDDEESIVGLAAAGAARDEDLDEAAGELYALYVDPDAWGRGHGTALDTAARHHLAGSLFTYAVLWVLEGNAEAQAFYERRGWRPDGARRPHAGSCAVRYRVELG